MGSMEKQQRILIAGSGAIGLYFGARLQSAGHDVTFLMSADAFELATQQGIRVTSINGDICIPQPQILNAQSKLTGSFDVVLSTCKADHVASSAAIIKSLLAPEASILSLQNGLGSEELLASMLPTHIVLGGTAFICAERTDKTSMKHTAAGRITLGAWNTKEPAALAAAECVASMLSDSGVSTTLSSDIREDLWKKLLWNASFNLITATSSISVGDLLGSSDGEALTRQAMAEVLQVAHVEGIMLPHSIIEQNISGSRGMGSFRTSMLVDRDHNRHLEIEAISGELLKRADKHAISMPLQLMLYRLLSLYNAGRSS